MEQKETVVGGFDQQWQADLTDLQPFMKHMIKIIIYTVCSTFFSKYAWVIIFNKTGESFIQAFKSFLRERTAKALQIAKGSDFKNKRLQSVLKSNDIHFLQPRIKDESRCIGAISRYC